MARSVAEILERASRGTTGLRTSARQDLATLSEEWKGIGLAGLPFIDFIPIRIVSLIERQVRHCLSEVIDFGEPYATRAIEFLGRDLSSKNILDAFSATASKKITLGRLVSFSFSVGKLSELLSTLEKIFGADVTQRLARTTTLWSEDDPSIRVPLIPNLNETLSVISRLLSLRHMLVHEATNPTGVRYEELDSFFIHATQFTDALSWLLIAQTRGEMPETQLAMKAKSFEDVSVAIGQLDVLRMGTSNDFKEPLTHSQHLEHHWDEFCRLSAERAAGYDVDSVPGTIAPLIYASEMKRLTRWRIEQLLLSDEHGEVDF